MNGQLDVGISTIKHELETVGHIDAMDIGDFNFVEFVVEGVSYRFMLLLESKLHLCRLYVI